MLQMTKIAMQLLSLLLDACTYHILAFVAFMDLGRTIDIDGNLLRFSLHVHDFFDNWKENFCSYSPF